MTKYDVEVRQARHVTSRETRFLEITFTKILLEFPKKYSCFNITFFVIGIGDLIIMFANFIKEIEKKNKITTNDQIDS